MSDTASVLGHHLQAFGIGLDEIMKDYTDESVIISQDSTAKGTAEIRKWFEAFIGGLPAGAMDAFKVTKQEAVGEVAFLTWKAEPFVLLGTDTFVIRDGKIVYQTVSAQPGG